jgi:hypothetical protein
LFRHHQVRNKKVLFEFGDDRLCTLQLLVEHLEISFAPQHWSADRHTIFNFSQYTVEQSVNKTDNTCFFVKVRVVIYTLEALHKWHYNELHVLELSGLFDLTDRFLNDFHVLMVPLGLFGPLNDPALLFHEGLDWLENRFIDLFVAVAEHLDGDLYVALFNFIVGGF